MNMKALGDAELLTLWERGSTRHPIDRALLLCAWARPDLSPSRLADLPLGALNRTLLRLREISFGQSIEASVVCEGCGERLEIKLDTAKLLANAHENDTPAEFEMFGLRFRVPCSRDLAAVAAEENVETAARKLLQQCYLARPDETMPDFTAILPKAEAAMDTLDPAADVNLELSCEECGHRWAAGFNIGTVLWAEIDARAGVLLSEVHGLARAYGWTEPEVLALSPHRRGVYLDMVNQ